MWRGESDKLGEISRSFRMAPSRIDGVGELSTRREALVFVVLRPRLVEEDGPRDPPGGNNNPYPR